MRQLHTPQHTQQMLHLQPLIPLQAHQTGTSAKVESGVYYIRGQFVRVAEQTHVVSDNDATASARVGFTITESLVTPESDSSLTDNATGSSNFAAKGAHRLKIELTLTSLAESSTADYFFCRNG